MTLRVPKALRPRKTAVLMASSHITAVVNGGKLSVISLPVLRIKISPSKSSTYQPIRSRLEQGYGSALALRYRHRRQTPVLFIIHRADREDDIIFGQFQGCVGNVSDRLGMLPFWGASGAPNDLVPGSAVRGVPGES